jgi:hypothetical protein
MTPIAFRELERGQLFQGELYAFGTAVQNKEVHIELVEDVDQ